jgi:hypothetical protein
MRSWRTLGAGIAVLALAAVAATGTAQTADARTPEPRPAPASGPDTASDGSAPSGTVQGGTTQGGAAPACAAFPGAHQLPGQPGASGQPATSGAAWIGDGLVVPACGPAPGDGTGSVSSPAAAAKDDAVYPYPGALWTAGYQCVEFSERYLYDRYGVTMDVLTNGDQVAAHYATNFPGLFMIIKNRTPHRAPADGDVLSLSNAAGFDSASGGHTAVVQSSEVDANGNGTVTVIEENATARGVADLAVSGWTVRYPGYRYIEWLTTTVPPQTGQSAAQANSAPTASGGYSPK